MSETAREYTERLFNNVGSSDPLEIMAGTPSRVQAVLSKLEGKGSARESSSGKWAASQIVAHFAEGEIVLAYRLRRILAGSGQTIEGYDQDEWVKNSGYLQADLQLAYSLFEIVRKSNVALIRSLTPEQMAFYGLHSERGKESISHLTRLYAGHDINHLKQLEAML